MSAVFTTTPTKPSLFHSTTTPVYHFEPYESPSSAHQRTLTTSLSQSPPVNDLSRRRLRSAAPSISSNSHHRRATGSLNLVNPAPPSGRAASFNLTPVGSPIKPNDQTPSMLYSFKIKPLAMDDGDLEMLDPSPVRPSQQQQQTRPLNRGSLGTSNRHNYREPRTGLTVSSSNDQLMMGSAMEGGYESSNEGGSRRGSLEEPGQDGKLRPRELSSQSASSFVTAPQDSPLKAQFSTSKSLGRAAGRQRSNSRTKRPASSMIGGMEDDNEGGPHSHPMPDFGGRMRLSSRAEDDSEEERDPHAKNGLRPLLFNHPHLSPAPSPMPTHRHQRALTEQDLNKPTRSISHSSSHGSNTKPLAEEDNIFLDSSTDSRPRSTTSTGGLFFGSTSLERSRSLMSAGALAQNARSTILSASGSALAGSSMSNSKKAVSMDNLQNTSLTVPSGDSSAPPSAFNSQGKTLSRSRRTGVLSQSVRPGGHKRGSSQDFNGPTVSRPATAVKSSSAQNLSIHTGTMTAHLATSTSASHLTSKLKAESSILNRSAPATFNRSPDDLDALAFNDAKPLLAAFTAKQSLGKKFKPRDSGISMDGDAFIVDSPMNGDGKMLPPPVPHRMPVPQFMPSRLSTTSLPSNGTDEMDLQDLMTPACDPGPTSGWPSNILGGGPSLSTSASTTAFDFLGRDAAEAMATAAALHQSTGSSSSKAMPDTPVKTKSFNGGLNKSLALHSQHPHPLSLSSIRAESSPGSSSPSAGPGSSALPPLGSTSDHHSLNVLARSHRPSDVKPPHLKPALTSQPVLNSPARSLIPKRSMTFRSKASSLQARFTATSPESQTGSSSPPSGAESPTFLRRVANGGGMTASPRVGGLAGMPRPTPEHSKKSLLRRTSSGVASMSGSESESGVEMTPTRRGPDSFARGTMVMTKGFSSPTHSQPVHELSIADLAGPSNPRTTHLTAESSSSANLQPRHSMPNLPPKLPSSRRLHHRSSHPLPQTQLDEDLFEKRFKVLDALGQGAFSQVWKVEERDERKKVWAVKRTKGVFEGVKDRLRHLEEVDILRCLSSPTHPHVVEFIDAWEQNCQLFIQTELCDLGNLAVFLEEYGRIVPRMDESRVWKIVRELSDGIYHIHSHDILHLDLKPANVLITTEGALKIGDFGLSTRHPRANPAEILRNAGLGGEVPPGLVDKGWEREGDRDYMASETLSGNFGKPADIFSFGLLILEAATNIIVPTNDTPWHSLRSDDFSDIDLSPLSPALIDLITLCMRSNPLERPEVVHVVEHPVVVRARRGKPALVPEPEEFLVECLTGRIETVGEWLSESEVLVEDVEMMDEDWSLN